MLADIESLSISLVPASEMIAYQGRYKQWGTHLIPLAQGCEELEAVTI